MDKLYFCRNFFLIDWRHKRVKNKIDLLLFCREQFYGFSESEYSKLYIPILLTVCKNISMKNVIKRVKSVKLLNAKLLIS